MKLKLLIIVLMVITGTSSIHAQSSTKISEKTLIIPLLGLNKDFQKYALKKGKTKDAEKIKEDIEKYNTAWKEGISQSMYDATAYEFSNELSKEDVDGNKSGYLYLYFNTRKKRETLTVYKYNGEYSSTMVAQLNIVGFDLKNSQDVRRAMNMLNSKMHEYVATGNKYGSDKKSNKTTYWENIEQKFEKNMKSKTLYVAKYEKGDIRGYNAKNKKIEEKLKKKWTICKYQTVSKEQLNDIVVNGTDPNGFYLISQKKKPRNALLFSVGLIYTYGLAPIIYFTLPHVEQTVLTTKDEGIAMRYKSYSRYKPGKYMKLQKKLKKK
ncbi:MAG TPA: hypothetical protein PLX60_09625 [Chitinophagales bacterium]|jgi:hypothetical protein|nr:hypothetical protein [Chitinophagales bacterium]